MKKVIALGLSFVLVLAVFAGCSGGEEGDTDEEETDTVSTASIVSEEADFQDAISEDGTWIIITTEDLSFDEELIVEGEFRNQDDSDADLYRKLALYDQDDDRNVTERYTVEAPRLTVRSPNTKIQGGTFVGDVYVEEDGFVIEDAEVDGNVYFAEEDYEESAELVNGGEVTGDMTVE
ncbi:MAG: hypothetical protein ACOCQB_03110 [Halanaerobiaceae bacterium]